MRLFGIALLNRDDVSAGLLVEFDHGAHAALLRLHDHVGQEQRERLVAHQVAGAPDRVPEAERHLLARKAGLSRLRLHALELGQFGVLSALGERVVEFELNVEMILDDALVAAGHEDELLDAGFPGLVDHVLDDGLVHDRQHLLGERLGGWQEPRSKPRNRENRLSDLFHAG